MRNNLPQQQGLDHFLVQSTTSCKLLCAAQSDLSALIGASFTLHARVEIGSPETFLVTKLPGKITDGRLQQLGWVLKSGEGLARSVSDDPGGTVAS